MAADNTEEKEQSVDLFTEFDSSKHFDNKNAKNKITVVIDNVMENDEFHPLMDKPLSKQGKADIFGSNKPESVILIAHDPERIRPDQSTQENYEYCLQLMDGIFIYLDRLRSGEWDKDSMHNIMMGVQGLAKIYRIVQDKLSDLKTNIQYVYLDIYIYLD